MNEKLIEYRDFLRTRIKDCDEHVKELTERHDYQRALSHALALTLYEDAERKLYELFPELRD